MGQARGRKTGAARLTHIDARGRARMVDVGAKPVTERIAVASATLHMQPATLRRIEQGGIAKGEVLAVARIAGIMAAKRTADLIPLCHPLPLTSVEVDLEPGPRGYRIRTRVRTVARTGVEMEALVAASVAALTLYDMLKAVDKSITITRVRLLEKRGGKSGDYRRGKGRGVRGD